MHWYDFIIIMSTLNNLKNELKKYSSKGRTKILQRFFKTGPGQYGEGDVFLGITVPNARKVAKKYNHLALADIKRLLQSKIHEERLTALLILVNIFEKSDTLGQKKIVNFYLKNTKYINNWDLVDLSADKILGNFLKDKSPRILYKLAKSKNLWERRIAMISTFYFIKCSKYRETLKLAKMMLKDKHDLIHKAVGWMLREIGKKDLKTEESFLKKYYRQMPRTMLRYAIEKFPKQRRLAYLKNKI